MFRWNKKIIRKNLPNGVRIVVIFYIIWEILRVRELSQIFFWKEATNKFSNKGKCLANFIQGIPSLIMCMTVIVTQDFMISLLRILVKDESYCNIQRIYF